MRQKPRKPAPQPIPTARPVDLYLCLLLAAVTLAVYSQAAHFDFLNYDDPAYVVNNPPVRDGFTWAGLVWAFTSFHAANWSPLTWLSHMADCQWFGLRSGWHHSTSVLLHTAAALLLFAALKRLTGARWPSAFVAFLFALHPLHVESVAWVAERKDVLCALFWFLALYGYARYVERPGVVRYLLVLAAFALGLMSKAMIVTLPFLLLLLDVWPLRRGLRMREKVPFFALAVFASVLTFVSQQRGDAVRSLAAVPLASRFQTALVAYAAYIFRMFWPVDLAPFYPYRFDLPLWQVVAATALLAGITLFVVRRARAFPYLAVGWCWYLATLVPVIGLVQVGAQSSADRYMYVPMVGLGIMLAWGAADLLHGHERARIAAASASLAVCAILTWHQLSFWTDSGTLFQHAAEVTSGNYLAQNNLAEFYLARLQNQDALPHIEEALRIRPGYADAHANLALDYRRLGRLDESGREYNEAIRLQPSSEPYHLGYGALLVVEGHPNQALDEFTTAVHLRPGDDEAHFNRARVLAQLGHADEAIAEFNEAIRLRPGNADARHALGFILLTRGRMDEAISQLRAEAELKPADAAIHYNLANLLMSAGRFDEAAAEYTRTLRLQPNFPDARRRLALAQAQRDRPHR